MNITKTATFAVAACAATLALTTGTANATPAWVEDEAASICNGLSLESEGYDWLNITISMLQLSQDIGRAEAVSGIRAAAAGYCPQYLSVVPSR